MRFFIEYRDVMCERCRALDARRQLFVDPGQDHPVVSLGKFCISCARNEKSDYEAGRKSFESGAEADAQPKRLTRRDLLLDVVPTIGKNARREEALHMVVKTHSIELSREEIIDQIEDGANRHGMTATQMLIAYSDGTLDDVSTVADLLALAHLLPDEDEVFGGRRLP